MQNVLTLYGELYSTKNSRRVVRTKQGRTVVLPSKVATGAQKTLAWQLLDNGNHTLWRSMVEGKSFPLCVGFRIFRTTHGRFDYINIAQGLCDAMVKANYLPDDDSKHLIPFFMPYEIDKVYPRVEIKIF